MRKAEITAGIEYALIAPNAYDFRQAERARFTTAGLAEKPTYKNQGKVLAEVYIRPWAGDEWRWLETWVMPSHIRQTYADYQKETEEKEARREIERERAREQYAERETEKAALAQFLQENHAALTELLGVTVPSYAATAKVPLVFDRATLSALLEKAAN